MARGRDIALAVLLLASTAEAAPRADGLPQLWRELHAAIDAAVAERVPRPPVPVQVTWRERRIASIDLGAPLLGVVAADLDRDGRADLAALTTREVVVLSVRGKGLVEKGRAGLGGELAAVRPRDPVGTLAIETAGGEVTLVARSSERADAVRMAWRGGRLIALERSPGFPLCAGSIELVPGRNYFAGTSARGADPLLSPLPPELFSGLCRADLVDARGWRISVAALVDLDRVLHVRCQSARGGECAAATVKARDYDGVGVVAEIADIDNDGQPEVLTTRGGAPGDRDRVSVYAVRRGKVEKIYSKDFHAGAVGLAAGDLDGDGDRDVIVAVRFAGSHHVSFWTLN